MSILNISFIYLFVICSMIELYTFESHLSINLFFYRFSLYSGSTQYLEVSTVYAGHRRQISGTNTESKLSLSVDSIDSEGVPFIDRHRISKSILKKSESSNNYYNNIGDSDTEKLITDNVSTISMCDNETNTCDVFTNINGTRVKQSVSPLLSKMDQSEEKNCVSKIKRSIFDEVLEGS